MMYWVSSSATERFLVAWPNEPGSKDSKTRSVQSDHS